MNGTVEDRFHDRLASAHGDARKKVAKTGYSCVAVSLIFVCGRSRLGGSVASTLAYNPATGWGHGDDEWHGKEDCV
jgi:hypothetical protein